MSGTSSARVSLAPTSSSGASLTRASSLTGTAALLRFNLRRDRIRIGVWTLSIGVMYLYCVVALGGMFGTAEAQQQRAALMSTPASVLLAGPGYGLDHYTLGPIMANELLLWFIVAVGIMSILQVVRLTRAEEESGRSELIRAGAVGRHAPSVAAALTVVVANVIIAVVSCAALVGGGLAAGESLAYVAAVALGSLVFGAVALVTAQVTEHGRGASGMAIAALMVAVAVRGAGDVEGLSRTPSQHGSPLSWFSPIGWMQQTRLYVDLRVWPLALPVALIAVLVGVSALLAGRRDFGAGLIAVKPGRADAGQCLRSPLAVTWRQQRSMTLWWAFGFALMFAASGTYIDSIGSMMRDMIAQNPAVGNIFNAHDITGSFVGVLLLLGAVTAAAYGMSALGRARAEESAGRAEYLLATPISRARWLAAQMAVPVTGAAALMVLAGVTTWAGAVSSGVTDPGLGDYLLASLTWLPAVAVVLGCVAALYGWAPRLMPVGWAFVAWGVFAGIFGQAMNLPGWALGMSPFHWVPNTMMTGAHHYWPVAWLTVIAVALFVAAFVGFRRRNIPVA
ncbi:MAG: hypothetical protein LBB54_04035 [Cellulomonadaceae bacterium]|nr:hypothetical protein [Cellulomonadaceae bacterium]